MHRATPKDHPLYDPRGGDAYWRIECMLLEFGATQWVARGSNPGILILILILILITGIIIIAGIITGILIIIYLNPKPRYYCYYYYHVCQ
jgi:hypothetical protein